MAMRGRIVRVGRFERGKPMTAGTKSVQWRILIWLLPLQIMIFVGFHVWLESHLTGAAESADLVLARQSQREVVHVIEANLPNDSGHGVWGRVVERIPRRRNTGIEILDTNGRVLYSADTSVVANSRRVLEESPCTLCHENGSRRPSVANAVLREAPGIGYQFAAAPLSNAEGCRRCHADEGQKLGMVLVWQSLRPVDEQVRTIQIASTTVGAMILLLTVLATRLQLKRSLYRPLGRILTSAEANYIVDEPQPIAVPPQPELAAVAATLNRSSERVSRLQRELRENERLAGVGQTVAGLSHTLKNVLNGLRAGRFVVDRAMRMGDERKLRKGLRVTRSSVRMVERLIFDMLQYAKDRSPQREPLDPNEIIHEVISELRQMAGGWGIELQADLDKEVGAAELDRIAVYRALVDLVTNAIEACTEVDTGTLVVLGSRGEPDAVVLSVEDNGIGMTQEVLSSLYTRFISTKATGGTGLGMVVVKKIVDEHGGTIDVDSVPGKGTVFRIRLPRSSEREAVPSGGVS